MMCGMSMTICYRRIRAENFLSIREVPIRASEDNVGVMLMRLHEFLNK